MKRTMILLTILAMAMLVPLVAEAFEEVGERPSRHLQVEVWLNKHNGSVYNPGQYVRVYFQASEDCYLAIYNVDAYGFVHVLYPKYNDETWVQGGFIYEIPDPSDDYDLVVDGAKGIEYVVAVASYFPLNMRVLYEIAEGSDYDVYWPAGHITGDPHLAIHEINQQLAWGDDEYEPEGYASDVSWFYVRQWVPYPRYIVYQWYPDYYYDPWWDPYVHVHIFADFYWDHYWCRPWWWCHGCHPVYVYWYIDRDTGRRTTWTGHYHRDRTKPDWYREKPLRRGGGDRPARPAVDEGKNVWEGRKRPTPSGPGKSFEARQTKAPSEDHPVQSRSARSQRTGSDQSQNKTELRTRSKPENTHPKIISERKSEREIRPPAPSRESRDREAAQRKSSSSGTVKKLEQGSRRSSGIGKIIGGVAKLFRGSDRKESSSSQKKTEQTSSKTERSSKTSSKSSNDSQKKTR